MPETIASYQVPEAHVKMFTANVEQELQKQGGFIMPLFTSDSYRGAISQVVQRVGSAKFTERDTPYSDTELTQVEHKSRWITGKEYDCAILIDRLDTLKMIYDPTSPYVEAMRLGASKEMDAICVNAFFATAKTGKEGVTDTAFKSTNVVGTGSGTGLNVPKLRAMRKMIKKAQNDLRGQMPCIAVTAEEVDDLLGEVEIQSKDYNQVQPLVDGEVSNYMGFKFIPYEDDEEDDRPGHSLPSETSGSTLTRKLPVWVMKGMHYGIWSGLEITISNRADKNNIKQAHATFTSGATRLEEKRVFQIVTSRTV